MVRVVFFIVLFAAITDVALSQTPSTPLVDLGGVVSSLDATGDIVPGTSAVSPSADIELQRVAAGDPVDERKSGVAHYDISSLNRDGVFSAHLGGNIYNAQPGESTSGVRVEYFSGNGSVQATDAEAPIVTRTASGDRTFFAPSTAATTSYDFDVTSAVREAALLGGTSFGVRYEAENIVGSSIVTALDPGDLVIDEYYSDPFLSLQPIIGETGFAFNGHDGEFVSQGQSALIVEPDYDVTASIESNNSIRVRWNGTGALPTWTTEFAAPDQALLQIGDSFDATREGVQDPGVAGFDFYGDGRGNNTLAANFTIHDVAYSGDTVTRLNATFSQWTVNGSGVSAVGQPKVFGRVLINVTAVPEPSVFFAIAMTSTGLLFRRRKRR